MKRPAIYIGFSYILGLITASVIHLRIVACISMLVLAMGLLLVNKKIWKYVLFSTLSCLIACCSYWHCENRVINKQINYIGQEVVFTGNISSQVIYDSGYAEYILKGCFQDDNLKFNIKLFCENQNVNYGDEIIISGIPERIQANYIFDSANYYQAKQVFLEFDAMTEIQEINISEHKTLRSIIYNWRASMTEKILSHMDSETGAMLTGMLFGDKSGMSKSTKKALYRTGIGHILAVSGLHLDFLASCVIFLLHKCKAGRKLSFGIIIITCSLFVLCAGETVSVKRACIMILISQGTKIVFREVDSLSNLAIAMLFLGVENPFVIYNSGFWLSCAGAFGIGVVANVMTEKLKIFEKTKILNNIFKNMIAFCWVFVVILPVSAFYFTEISLISPLSNLLLVPICMISLLFGFIAVIFGCHGRIAELCLSIANILNNLILKISDYLANSSWTHASTDSEVLLFLLVSGVILVILCQVCFKNKLFTSFSVIIALLITCIFVNIENILQEHDLKIAVLGSGKNCFIIVTQRTDGILIDISGNYQNANYASVYLEQKGIKNLQALYLCSPKETSIANYNKYLNYPKPDKIYVMKELENAENFEVINHQEILFHGALLEIQEDYIKIEYEDKIYICTNEKKIISETPDILTIYGTSENVQLDCGILIILDENSCYKKDNYSYIGENNLEIVISEHGKCQVRRLYGDS